jgi:hypothetical protein
VRRRRCSHRFLRASVRARKDGRGGCTGPAQWPRSFARAPKLFRATRTVSRAPVRARDPDGFTREAPHPLWHILTTVASLDPSPNAMMWFSPSLLSESVFEMSGAERPKTPIDILTGPARYVPFRPETHLQLRRTGSGLGPGLRSARLGRPASLTSS